MFSYVGENFNQKATKNYNRDFLMIEYVSTINIILLCDTFREIAY